jgi:hypothetical protein
MKFSRFIAATSLWGPVVSDSASAASGSRPGVLCAWASNCTTTGHPAERHPRPRYLVGLAEEVEDAEILLVVIGPKQFRARARATADHLPELDLRVDRLEFLPRRILTRASC